MAKLTKALSKARRTARSISKNKLACENPKTTYVGTVVDFYDVHSGKKVARPIDEVKSYSLARGKNVNRSKGKRSYIAFHHGPNGTITRSLGICSSKRGSRSGTRSRRYIRKNKKRSTKH